MKNWLSTTDTLSNKSRSLWKIADLLHDNCEIFLGLSHFEGGLPKLLYTTWALLIFATERLIDFYIYINILFLLQEAIALLQCYRGEAATVLI